MKKFFNSRRMLQGAIALSLFYACGPGSEEETQLFPDFRETGSGLYFKVLKLGEGDSTASVGDIITIHMTYRTQSDSVFLQRESTFTLSEPAFEGSFEEGLRTMKEGDSLAFQVRADSLFPKLMGENLPDFIDSGAYVRVDVLLTAIHPARQIMEDAQAYAEWLDNADMREVQAMKDYLEKNQLLYKIKPTDGGLFVISKTKVPGKRAGYGKRVVVHYRGTFLNGKEFDNSRKNNGEGLDFTMGTEGQVIKGVEMALTYMSQGETMKVMLPSFLAYGKDGSEKIVPPVTPVIYEIELIKVY
ncbi:MAG: FKBP-type peptidyl-prolyl cis-trans isomerase [Flavobacteriales bacterium]|nr:FKBP-type peptidyl-prolyl cis-trans isomerase [Flavobacteriales bacterium]